MDWTDCDIIERVSGKMSGEPVIKGTRVLAQTIVDNFESGSSPEEIHENYPHISLDKIGQVLAHVSMIRFVDSTITNGLARSKQ